jgi:anti-sigma factor RsiW
LLTCKDFLKEMNDYLDEHCDAKLRAELETHLTACPNCFVIADTTKKTIRIYRGQEPMPVPDSVKSRLMAALQKKMTERRGGASGGCTHG